MFLGKGKEGWMERSRGICAALVREVVLVAIIDFMPHPFRKVKPE